MRAWVAREFGAPADVLAIDDVEVPVPGPDDVLVKVATATVNNNDIDAIRGRWASLPVPAPFVPGLEVAGVVEQAGENGQHLIGKRVVDMPRGCFGGFADYAVPPKSMTFEVPDDFTTEQAGGLFWPFHLAWPTLFTRADLQKGEMVLVHSAAGGASSSAIQLARSVGARVIATVGSDAKIERCLELGANAALNHQTGDLVEQVLAADGGRGIDVCLDGTGGDLTEQTWRCLGFGARHVITGFSSGIDETDGRPVLLRDMIFGNFSLMGALLLYVDTTRLEGTGIQLKDSSFNFPTREQGEQVQTRLVELMQSGVVRPVIDRVIGFVDLPEALAAFERREIVGRVVVKM